MSALRRCCLALLLVVSTGSSLAQASPIDIGFVSVFDAVDFGPSVTVFNDSDQVLAPGDEMTNLSLELFDSVDQSLAVYMSASLLPGSFWAPGFSGPVLAFGALARVEFSALFRQQVITATLQTCAPDDQSDGCVVEYLAAPGEDIDCLTEPDLCEPQRSGGAVLTYREPDPQPVPAPLPLVPCLAGGAAALLRRRHARS